MSTEQPSAGQRWLVPGAALAAGLLIMALAIPRVAAYGVIASDRGLAAAALNSGAGLPSEVLGAARERYGTAHSLHPSDGGIALALARLDLRARPREGDPSLAEAVAHLRAAAAAKPNDAFVWSQLARTALLAGAAPDEAAAYLHLSRLTGRFEASSLLARLPVALAYWDGLPPDLREGTVADLRRIWNEPRLRTRLINLYLGLGYPARAVLLRETFEDDRDRDRFTRWVLKRAGQPRSPR